MGVMVGVYVARRQNDTTHSLLDLRDSLNGSMGATLRI